MGYSCSAKASFVLDKIRHYCYTLTNSSNVWEEKEEKYFWERGRENWDGAITGTIYKFLPNDMARKCGGFKIDAEGKIVRFPGLPKKYWKDMENHGRKLVNTQFGIYEL